jgi:hypothetical protein
VKISQREARRMRKELAEFRMRDEQRARYWSSDWAGGVHIGTSHPNASVIAAIQTARKLGHPVIAVTRGDGEVLYYAAQRSGDAK